MRLLATLALTSALAGPAAASITRIDISQTARLEGGELRVDVRIGNSGDEAALSVNPVLRFGDREVRGESEQQLEPDASIRRSLAIPVGALGEGRWPYRVSVDYTDLNQYPFQALQVHTFVVGTPPPAKVAVPEIQGGEVRGDGALAITVKNLTPDARTAQLEVLVPAGIEVGGATRELRLEAWGEARVEVPLHNRSALVGSRYPAFVTVQYEDGAVHHTALAQGWVVIVGTGTFVERWGSWMAAAGWALVLGWTAYLGWLRMRPRQAAGQT